ncbi:RING finger domain protein [Aspergillus heteromorphus CBS 117.55]|uniref:RING finger domain protein n=1 Tax=Aspergillus heteromorphus CBS 117.55 TaxID=1448321 RepID=A0A317X1L1_9EURO|nr:RING finger domain protein [Aspergillus heteromorphus CBS 117.55]PWY92524.1 RING finger domain protein [Aspergillus heteromorphus CBS 117.55]
MASVPGYSASGRPRSSDDHTTSTPQESDITEGATNCDSSTELVEDTDTVLLNKSAEGEDDTATRESPIATPTFVDEPRKCWICYTDETEDSPLNSEWRSPCPCALTAHEACLLDWLADLENPRSRRRNGHTAKMMCPQCKTEIIVSRPRSYIVDIVRLFERVAGRLVLPGMVFTLAGTVWAGCCAHGVYSMYFVFGTDEARQILEETADGPWNSGLNLGLPLIPMVLIFSRTRYAEGLLPAIPVMFFATHQPGQEVDLDLWPPSAAVTFAALPYVKSFYSAFYEKMFGNLERRWVAEVQPRQSDVNEFDDNAPPEHPEPMEPNGDNGLLMEIDLELQVGMGNDDGPQGLLGFNGGRDAQGNGQEQNQGGGGQPLGLGRRDDLIHETSNLADIILGALAFPAISASMGGLLKYLLPVSWTTTSALDKARPGLLQTRWGRSVVGGCAFVLLKDALVLYCRWKLAQTHRRRKVLNYDRSKKQASAKR